MKKSLQDNKINNHSIISIIVPIYNTDSQYLHDCLNSLVNQTFDNIEIILVDDGSINDVEKICSRYAEKDKRIKYINKKNGGVSSARNLGLENATGEYIMFVDSDDWIDLETCDVALSAAKAGNYDLVYWNYIKELPKNVQKKIFLGSNNDFYDMQVLGSTCMKLYCKDCLKKMKFDTNIKNGEDVEFNLRVFKNIQSAKFIDKYYYHYIIHEESAVRRYDDKMIDNYEITLKQMYNDCENDKEKKVYFTFSAISYLMILMNYIVTKNNKKGFFSKIRQIKLLSKNELFKNMLKNSNIVELPFTRKAAIICSKFKLYIFSYMIVRLKLILDRRK